MFKCRIWTRQQTAHTHARTHTHTHTQSIVGHEAGRVASPDVVVQLTVKTKCVPILYYAIEMCPTNKSDVLSLQYVIDIYSRQIFNVKSKDVVHECETEFGVFPVTDVIDIRKKKLS